MFEKNKKNLFIIIPIVLLLIIGITVTFVLLTPEKEDTNDIPSESSGDTTSSIPVYELFGSTEALGYLKEKALQWASDTQFLSCSGLVLPYDDNGSQLYIGSENGEFPSWNCNIFSNINQQDTVVQLYKGSTTLLEPHTQWGIAEFEIDPNDRPMFNTDSFIDSSVIYASLVTSGYDSTTSYITFNFGLSNALELYNDRPVWQINEYSRTELEDPLDEYSQGKLLNIYYYDAISGEKL